MLNFDKTQGQLPNQKKYTKVQSNIIKGFVANFPSELLVLFKQRYMEAKAFGGERSQVLLNFRVRKVR